MYGGGGGGGTTTSIGLLYVGGGEGVQQLWVL